MVYCSPDAGYTWKDISKGLPKNLWVSRVQASAFVEGRVYVSLNGYRWDDFSPYLYVSENYGKRWTQIGKNLPDEPVNVIKEDPKKPNILYVGTDHGVYVSLNKGQTFEGMNKDLPNAPVHDLVIQPKTNDLIIGTHGRSIYITDVTHLQQLNTDVENKNLYVFKLPEQKSNSNWGKSWSKWRDKWEPKVQIPVYVNRDSEVKVIIKADSTLVVKQFTQACTKGINYIEYDLSIDTVNKNKFQNFLNAAQPDACGNPKEPEEKTTLKEADNKLIYLQKGVYIVELKGNGGEAETELIVK